MRVLITGGTGFIGSSLAHALLERGEEVRCLVRPGRPAPVGTARVEGDVTRPDTLVGALEGVEVCYHLAGIRRASTRADFMRVNAEGTRHLTEALIRAGGRRLVLCSSLAASGPSGSRRPKVESDPLCPEEWYGESKAVAECIAFASAPALEITAIRPCRVLGPHDRENLGFFRLAKWGWVLKIGGAERRASLVDVDDVVQQLILQGTRPEAVGEAFFCASAESSNVEDLMREISAALQVTPRTVYLPEWVLLAAGATADMISNTTGSRLPLNRKLARQLLAPGWVCSAEKAHRLLGFRPTVSISDSLKRSAEAYAQAGWL